VKDLDNAGIPPCNTIPSPFVTVLVSRKTHRTPERSPVLIHTRIYTRY
jgi:hypothetical protein